ncbi:hypothetical protein CMI40_02445 [Candidatus Pacearchaeota archaeon]|nr:hypothetical protein [Candidatus Pacearchaeota archaeon]|tara:strand:- start:924 stop:1658 length:735 start_codon:yes stop_codon:yes gene_type:complete
MTYPKFHKKHLEEALFHPGENRKKLKGKLPKKCIIIYDIKLIDYLKRKYKIKKDNKLSILAYDVYLYKGLAIVKMKGIGSPHVISGFEVLIYSGGKIFINIGYAGGLYSEGFFLCTKAIRDEGTSPHYNAHTEYAYPDKNLTDKFERCLRKNDINFERGVTWTIDAPFRETKKEIQYYRKKGVKTAEMETSALFIIAKYRNVKIASCFIVSDVLGDEWKPISDDIATKKDLRDLFEIAVKCLKG